MNSAQFAESDLYPPIKRCLESHGYTVHGEVGGCDVAARKDGRLVLIEFKRAINLDLLLQIVQRQEAAESVYAAVPAPRTTDKRWHALTRLLKRLEVGLLLVNMHSAVKSVEVAFHPVLQPRRPVQRVKQRALLTEMDGRTSDLNQGGSLRRPLMTAYREEALKAALALERLGSASPKALRELGAGPKTGAILLANHYGWFDRLGVGRYALTNKGREALEQYSELASALRERMQESRSCAGLANRAQLVVRQPARE